MVRSDRSSPKCRGTRKDGSRCTSPTIGPSGFCFAHDPARAAQRTEARSRGGRNGSNLARISRLIPARLGSVYERLEKAMEETHSGQLDPKIANALASLARAAAAVLTAGEMEQRLRDLEAKAEAA
jgi:hypothetical protein